MARKRFLFLRMTTPCEVCSVTVMDGQPTPGQLPDTSARPAVDHFWPSFKAAADDAGIDTASMEGDPACPREVHLPGLREDQPGSRAVPCDREGLGRSQSSGDDPVREVWAASAAQSPSRTLCQGRRTA